MHATDEASPCAPDVARSPKTKSRSPPAPCALLVHRSRPAADLANTRAFRPFPRVHSRRHKPGHVGGPSGRKWAPCSSTQHPMTPRSGDFVAFKKACIKRPFDLEIRLPSCARPGLCRLALGPQEVCMSHRTSVQRIGTAARVRGCGDGVRARKHSPSSAKPSRPAHETLLDRQRRQNPRVPNDHVSAARPGRGSPPTTSCLTLHQSRSTAIERCVIDRHISCPAATNRGRKTARRWPGAPRRFHVPLVDQRAGMAIVGADDHVARIKPAFGDRGDLRLDVVPGRAEPDHRLHTALPSIRADGRPSRWCPQWSIPGPPAA